MMKKTLLSLILAGLTTAFASAQTNNITLVIHGGAGTIARKSMTPEREKAYREVLNQALQTGYGILKKGGTSLDAVEATIRVMENSPLFNAGKGAVFTHEGKNELDAAVMDGKTGKAGAIAGVTTIRNPISTARRVMEYKSLSVRQAADEVVMKKLVKLGGEGALSPLIATATLPCRSTQKACTGVILKGMVRVKC